MVMLVFRQVEKFAVMIKIHKDPFSVLTQESGEV